MQQIAQDLVARHGGDADLLDFQAAGDVGQADGRLVVGAGRQGHAQHGQHHVAGAGDVVDLPRPGRKHFRPAVGVDQRHAFLVERDDGRLQVELFAQLGGGWPAPIAVSPRTRPVARPASRRFGVIAEQP